MEDMETIIGKQRQKTMQQTIPYFSLPGEIRNQIMRELLLIGDIVMQP